MSLSTFKDDIKIQGRSLGLQQQIDNLSGQLSGQQATITSITPTYDSSTKTLTVKREVVNNG